MQQLSRRDKRALPRASTSVPVTTVCRPPPITLLWAIHSRVGGSNGAGCLTVVCSRLGRAHANTAIICSLLPDVTIPDQVRGDASSPAIELAPLMRDCTADCFDACAQRACLRPRMLRGESG